MSSRSLDEVLDTDRERWEVVTMLACFIWKETILWKYVFIFILFTRIRNKSMRFCKINVHISNIINTFFSLPLTVQKSCRRMIFILQKRMDSLQEAFIFPWSCVRDVLLRMRSLYFTSSELLASRVSKTQANFHFWVNLSFKCGCHSWNLQCVWPKRTRS